MADSRNLKRRINDLKRGLARAARAARQAADAPGSGRNVNVAGRTNVVVARNVGADGASRSASAKQSVRIRQNGEETYEESVTTRTTSES